MNTNSEIKSMVREKYTAIADQPKHVNAASCCGATANPVEGFSIMSDDYSQLSGYVADADLGLGCGLPTQHAKISQGNTVIDLGSGAGNDAFVARKIVGETGKVIGIDFTEAMINRARTITMKLLLACLAVFF